MKDFAPTRRFHLTPSQRFVVLTLLPAALYLLAFQLTPLLYAAYISVHEFSPWAPSHNFVGIQNYVQFLLDPNARTALFNSTLYIIAVVPCSFVLGFALALLLNRDFPGKMAIRALLLLPLVISPIVAGTAWAFIFNDQYGFANYVLRVVKLPTFVWLADPVLAFWVIILVGIWITTPFFFIVLFAGLQSLPVAPYEAAMIDGASARQTLRYVTIPLLSPVIALSVILMTLEALRVYDTVYLLTYGGPGRATEVLSILAYKESFQFYHMGYGASISNVTAIIGIAVGVLFLRVLRRQTGRE